MLPKKFYSIFLFLFFVFLPLAPNGYSNELSSQNYSPTYELFIELGKKALDNEDYYNAARYFKQAQIADPQAEEPVSYINLLKRKMDRRFEAIPDLDIGERLREKYKVIEQPVTPPLAVKPIVSQPEKPAKPVVPDALAPGIQLQPQKTIVPVTDPINLKETIYLDDIILQSQPSTPLKVEL